MGAQDHHWHWEQGIKFALDGLKAGLALNGAAAVGLMTFAGATRTEPLVGPLWAFAVGVILSALAYAFAYWTQLQYGNAMRPEITKADSDRLWSWGLLWNWTAAGLLLGSVVAFAVGIVLAALALPNLKYPPPDDIIAPPVGQLTLGTLPAPAGSRLPTHTSRPSMIIADHAKCFVALTAPGDTKCSPIFLPPISQL
jgi:hypothetical protein